jgi:Sulfatase
MAKAPTSKKNAATKKTAAKKSAPRKADAVSTAVSAEPDLARHQLPIPDPNHVGLTTYDAKDPNTKYPPITELRPPKVAPNVLIVLIDDVGFGATSAFGGPCNTPVAERLGANGLKLNRFHHRVVLADAPSDADRAQSSLGRNGRHH